jgi:hypothetical protein
MVMAELTVVNKALISFRERVFQLVLLIVAARHLGHGRRMEGYLVISKAMGMFIMFLFPGSFRESMSLESIFWAGYAHYVFAPFAVSFVFSFHGLFGNIFNWKYSRLCRFLGGFTGFFIWIWFIGKLIHTGDIGTIGLILAIPAAFYGETGVMF